MTLPSVLSDRLRLPVVGSVTVPLLMINSEDDPICVAQNARDHAPIVQRKPNLMMVTT